MVKFLQECTKLTKQRVVNFLDIANANGHEEMSEYLRASGICVAISPDIIVRACRAGRLGLVQQHADYVRGQLGDAALRAAVWTGHLDIVKWIMSHCFGSIMQPVPLSTSNLEVLKWFHSQGGGEWAPSLMDDAAGCGDLKTVQWLHEHRFEGCTENAMDLAAWGGHIEVVKWLHVNWTEGCTTDAMKHAAQNGHLDVLKWLYYNRTEGFTAGAIRVAAFYGHIGIVTWLYSHRPDLLAMKALRSTVIAGNHAMLQHLCKYLGGPASREVIIEAGIEGHMPMLQWLYDKYPSQVTFDEIRHGVRFSGNQASVVAWLDSRWGHDTEAKRVKFT